MPAFQYRIVCYASQCENQAEFKLASRWSDGITSELKTYSLSCDKCLGKLLLNAEKRRQSCRLAPGEFLDSVRIYSLSEIVHNREASPLLEMEKQIREQVQSA